MARTDRGSVSSSAEDRGQSAAIEDGVVPTDRMLRRLEERGLEARWVGDPPDRLAGLSDDSRRVSSGDLFCAVRGLRHDGHDFLPEAARRGAAAALVERASSETELPQLVVADTRLATAHLAELFHGDPSRALTLVGVTGTNGKTTTVWLLRHLMADRAPSGSMGTLGVVGPDGTRRADDLTTPPPVAASRHLASLRDRGARYVAMEVSSHALDQRRVDGLGFRAMVFTNLSREHLDYHGDMEAYRRAKLRAAELVGEEGVCAVNADEPAWEELDPGRADLVTYGLSSGADVRARDVRVDQRGSRWRMEAGGREETVRLPLPGAYNVHNALAAVTFGLREGVSLSRAAERLEAAPPVPGRMEVLARSPCTVVRDYAHTPDALRRVLETLRPEAGRLFVVFGCGGDRDAGKRPQMGRVAAGLADMALVTTDNPRSEDPAEIAAQVVKELPSSAYEVVLDRRRAIERAMSLASAEDVVLLAGKGHETYQVVGEEKRPFDEAEIVAELAGRESTA